MAKGDRACPRFVHSVVCALLLLSGGGLLGYGIYRKVAGHDGPFSLDYEAAEVTELDNVWSFVLRFNLVLIIAGGFLALAGIAALIAISRNFVGKVFRFIFFFMAVVIFLVLAGLSAGSFYLLAKNGELDGFVTRAWESTVESSPNDICALEKEYECRGFKSGDCSDCPTGVGAGCTDEAKLRCAPCSGNDGFVDNGCWNEFQTSFKKYYIIVGAVCAALAVLALVDIFLLCCL